MRLADTNFNNSETGCCGRLNRSVWDDQELDWQDKLFVKDHVRSFLHVPLNFGSVISRDFQLIEEAQPYPEQPLAITDEVSPWGADLYVAVDREVPAAGPATWIGSDLPSGWGRLGPRVGAAPSVRSITGC